MRLLRLVVSVGWQGKFKRDDPEVVRLRQQLAAAAGIPQLEIVDPAVPGFAQRWVLGALPAPPPNSSCITDELSCRSAKSLLSRDGFCVIRDVLDAERLAKLRRGCEIVIREMVGRDRNRLGNRGSHRYSFGQAPAHFGRQDEWATMIDPPVLSEVLSLFLSLSLSLSPPPAPPPPLPTSP